MYLLQWRSKAAEGADRRRWQSGGGDKIGVITAKIGGDNGKNVSDKGHITTSGGGKLQSTPGANNPRYAADLVGRLKQEIICISTV